MIELTRALNHECDHKACGFFVSLAMTYLAAIAPIYFVSIVLLGVV